MFFTSKVFRTLISFFNSHFLVFSEQLFRYGWGNIQIYQPHRHRHRHRQNISITFLLKRLYSIILQLKGSIISKISPTLFSIWLRLSDFLLLLKPPSFSVINITQSINHTAIDQSLNHFVRCPYTCTI